MKRIAVLGAGGFVGSRFVEHASLIGGVEVIPVLRSFKGGARLARFGRRWRMADASCVSELRPAISDCDAVVNLTLGDFGELASGATAIWDACAAENVPQLIHLSSAEVFGQVDSPDVHDDTPPLANHWMDYARGKAAAEEALRLRFSDSRVACIILRPGLIWGPRSPWVEGPANQFATGRAFLLGGGHGICNLLYVDNLIYSILGVVDHKGAKSGCYNLADNEITTWREYYEALARELRIDFAAIHQLPADAFCETMATRLAGLKQSPLGKWLKRKLGKGAKRRLKRAMASLQKAPLADGLAPAPVPVVTRNDWHLQNTRRKLPTAKFTRTFGSRNRYSFGEAMARTGEWMRFAGFSL
jgi:nucleoside-diphosphate-sugar epimerase